MLGPLKWKTVLSYIDDALIPDSDSIESLIKKAELVLDIYRKFRVQLNPHKSYFGFDRIGFLGHACSMGGKQATPD